LPPWQVWQQQGLLIRCNRKEILLRILPVLVLVVLPVLRILLKMMMKHIPLVLILLVGEEKQGYG